MRFAVPAVTVVEYQVRSVCWSQPHADDLLHRRIRSDNSPRVEHLYDRLDGKEIDLGGHDQATVVSG